MQGRAIRERRLFLLYLLIGLVLIAATRVPQLLGENARLDGDESIVGLMAMHVARGEEAPLFFWGQRYGLSIVEASAGAVAFRVFGVSDVVLRLTMLVLWSAGWILFSLALRARSQRYWLALLLVLCPAWGAWSMLARGGYVTAFVLTGGALWLLTAIARKPGRWWSWFALGVLMAVIAYAQVLWALSLVPFVLFPGGRFFAGNGTRIRNAIILVAGLVTVSGAVRLVTAGAADPLWAPKLFEDVDVLQGLAGLPHRTFTFFTGSFYYDTASETGPITRVAAALWSIVLVVALAGSLSWRWLVRRMGGAARSSGAERLADTPRTGEAVPAADVPVAAMSILSILGFAVLLGPAAFQYRYLLPIPAVLVMLLAFHAPAVELGSRHLARLALVGVIALGGAGAASATEGARYTRFRLAGGGGGWPAEDVEPLVADLRSHDVRYVYCTPPLLQWSVMFYSNEEILARWTLRTDRYPKYPSAVDKALLAGRKVAVVGPCRQVSEILAIARRDGYQDLRVHQVGNWLCWLEGPDARLIRDLGYELNEP